MKRTFALLGEIPAGVTVVSESGIGDAGQLARLQAAGVAAVLVGESLMRAPVPAEALRALRATIIPQARRPGADEPAKSFS